MIILNLILPLIWTIYLSLLTFAIIFKNSIDNIPILWNLILEGSKYQERKIHLIPFENILYFISIWHHDYAKMNLLVNIALFMPFGFLIRIKHCRTIGVIYTVLFSFMTSLIFELMQYYYGIGEFDVDDIILNIIGAIMGYLLLAIVYTIKTKSSNKKL